MTPPNEAQYEAWNGERAHAGSPTWTAGTTAPAPVAELVLDAADLRPTEHVLDIGRGCGATTLAAAEAVTLEGSATGIDLSEVMLDLARRRAAAADAANATFIAADAQSHPFGSTMFDVAISRFGTMFFDDPAAAFVNIADAMRTGGRLLTASWQPLEANDWLTVPGAALLAFGSLPVGPAIRPWEFAQSDPDSIVSVLRDAGWTNIVIEQIQLTLCLGTDA